MTIDYDSFTPEERDTFVKNVLSEKELLAAVNAVTRGGLKPKPPEEILEFCFRVAVKKMEQFRKKVKEKRAEGPSGKRGKGDVGNL